MRLINFRQKACELQQLQLQQGIAVPANASLELADDLLIRHHGWLGYELIPCRISFGIAFEEPNHGHIEQKRQLVQPAATQAIVTRLIFVHLEACGSEGNRQILLAHTKLHPPLPQALPDVSLHSAGSLERALTKFLVRDAHASPLISYFASAEPISNQLNFRRLSKPRRAALWRSRCVLNSTNISGENMSLSAARAIAHSNQTIKGNFLDHAEVLHGPVGLLGRYFLKAHSEARARGVTLSFASLPELVKTNEANPESWLPLVAVFNDRFFRPTPDNVICIVGRDPSGRIVATHAARLYDWSGTNFHEEATSLRLFYDNPKRMRRPDEACEVTAPSAKTVAGLTIFSGAAWYHPEYRGRGLSTILPHVGKAYALTRWPAGTIVSMMAEGNHARGFAPRFGYTNVDWHVFLRNSTMGTRRMAFLSVTREQTFDIISKSLAGSAQIDGAVLGGSA